MHMHPPSVHVEVKGPLWGAVSLFPHGFWGLNSGDQACRASTFTHGTFSAALHPAFSVGAGGLISSLHACATNHAEPSQLQCLVSIIGWL